MGASAASTFDQTDYADRRRFVPIGSPVGDELSLPDIDVEEHAFREVFSHELTEVDWIELARLVAGLQATDGGAPVIVAHGTNTIEETAYFLDLVLSRTQPVVLAGAMRPAGARGADGPSNLRAAILAATSGALLGSGVTVVSDGAIFAARDVVKVETTQIDAFGSRDYGPLGYVMPDDSVIVQRQLADARRPVADVRDLVAMPRVDLVVSHVGADGALVDAAVAVGARGIVSAGTGLGWPTPREEAALRRAEDAGIVVCQSTRVMGGFVRPRLNSRKRINGRNLSPWKARILLALGLTTSTAAAELQRLFDAR